MHEGEIVLIMQTLNLTYRVEWDMIKNPYLKFVNFLFEIMLSGISRQRPTSNFQQNSEALFAHIQTFCKTRRTRQILQLPTAYTSWKNTANSAILTHSTLKKIFSWGINKQE